MSFQNTYGDWTTLKRDGRKALCECSCGEQKWVWITNLTTGKSTSCGHVRNNYTRPSVGDVVGSWTIGEYVSKNHVRAKCSCGEEKTVYVYSLGTDSKSCGHERRTGPRARLKNMWEWMHSRCENDRDPMYKYYGAKGVFVDEEWDDPEAYIDWAIAQGFKKSSGLQIDRIDNDGPYSPSNCRVTTTFVNANNKSNNRRLTAWGETKTVAEWSRDSRCLVSYHTLTARVRKAGMTVEEALTAPLYLRPYR